MIPPKNRAFGIDHPLVSVRDFKHAFGNYEKLGFSPSPVSYHPWGTATSLMMFENNFIELIGVDDASKFGANSVNGFCFGRFLGNFLERSEGISLVALHSKRLDDDLTGAVERGIKTQGKINFRRKMTNPDGTPGEAVVALGMLLDEQLGDVSNFLCQQHRPELIWIKEWQQHPNGATGIKAITYLADETAALEKRWTGLYGEKSVFEIPGGIAVDSGCGEFRAIGLKEAASRFGDVGLPESYTKAPHGIAITVSVRKLDKLKAILDANSIPYGSTDTGLGVSPQYCGNVVLEFVE